MVSGVGNGGWGWIDGVGGCSRKVGRDLGWGREWVLIIFDHFGG